MNLQSNQKQSKIMSKQIQQWYKFIQNKKLPMKTTLLKQQFNKYINFSKNKHNQLQLFKKIDQINKQAIQKQFSTMMQIIFIEIESKIDDCYKQRSLHPIYSIIEQNLNRQIFPENYRLNYNSKQLVTYPSESISKSNKQQKNQLSNILFSDLMLLMSLLLQQYAFYYQIQSIDQISEAISESMFIFSQQNQHSRIVQMDESSLIQQDSQTFKQFLCQLLDDAMNDQHEDNKMEEQQQKVSKNSIWNKIVLRIQKNSLYKQAHHKFMTISDAIGNIKKQIYKIQQPSQQINKLQQIQKVQQMAKSIISSKIKSPKKHNSNYLTQQQFQFIYEVSKSSMQELINNNLISHYKYKLSSIVTQVCYNDSCQFGQLKEAVILELKKVIECCLVDYDNKNQNINTYDSQFFDLKEIGMISMIIVFRSVQKNYDPYRRRIIKKIFRQLQEQLGLTLRSILVLTQLQKLNIKQLSHIHKQILADTNTQNINCEAGKDIQLQLKRIEIKQFNRQYKMNKLHLVRLSKDNVRSKVVNFMISGFLSQDSDKLKQWKPFVDEMENHQIYGVVWASKSKGEMYDYAINSITDLAMTGGGIKIAGGPFIRAAAIIHQIYEKYQQNPFNPALGEAQITGYFLAELIISSFRDCFINLIGFSLGTQVILATLKRLQTRNYLHIINKVIMMGGAADYRDFIPIIQQSTYPLDITNLYSQNDSVLKYLLRVCKLFAKPIGLYNIKILEEGEENSNLKAQNIYSHQIKNQDCSDFVSGHMDYRRNMRFIAGIIDLKNDI